MQQGKQTKERLLDEAAKLFRQKGFGATSLNDLLATVGIKKGSLYYHFPGKDDLGLAVLERSRATFFAFLDEALAAPSPREGLQRFFDAVLERHRAKGFVGGCLFGNTALEMSDAGNRYTQCVSRLFSDWTSRIEAAIRAGQQVGQFRTDVAPGDLAELIVSTIEGGIMMSRLRKEEHPLKTCLDSLRVFLDAKTE